MLNEANSLLENVLLRQSSPKIKILSTFSVNYPFKNAGWCSNLLQW